MALVLTWLLSLMALLDLDGRIEVFDFKPVLPILVLLVGPAAVHGLKRVEPARLFYALIALYVLATGLLLATGTAGTAVRGYGRFLRYDVSGSLVTHASLCAIALVLAVAAARTAGRALPLALHLTVALAAAAMLLLAATRTALVAFALYAVLSLIAGPERDRRATRFVGASVLAIMGFLLYSAVWSDAFLARLTSPDQTDYTSGRIVSVRHWLGVVEEQPLGLGPGAVRDLLADGRPDIDGENLLEWPHNEVVRFVVEGGPFGGAFILVLLFGVVRGAIVAARREGGRAPPGADARHRRRPRRPVPAAELPERCLSGDGAALVLRYARRRPGDGGAEARRSIDDEDVIGLVVLLASHPARDDNLDALAPPRDEVRVDPAGGEKRHAGAGADLDVA